jgi:hypothetical protein
MWRTGLLLVLVAGACDRRQLSLFAPGAGARDAGADGAGGGNGDGDRSRRCDTEFDCTDERPFCENARCVQCLTTGNCERDQSCRFEDHTCVATCFDREDCAGGGRPICALAAGVCVECAGPEDCEDAQDPFCELRTGRCVDCLRNDDCGGRLCHPEAHECVDCVDDEDCEGSEECIWGECQR